MMKSISLYNCRILVEKELLAPGWVKVEHGKIADFGKGVVKGDIDGHEDFLFPGLVDFHCCAFQKSLCPRPGSHMPTRIAKICHETLCLKGGITTVLNTVRLSDISVWNEADGTIPMECQAICQELPESKDGPNQLVHLRCDLAWPEIAPKTISFVTQYCPRVISFIRCCPNKGRFQDAEAFETYLRQRWRENILEASRSLLTSRDPGDDVMWERAKNIISNLNSKDVAFAIHDPSEASDILRAAECKIQVAEFPVNSASVNEARNQQMVVCMSAPNVLRGGSQYGNLSTREVWEKGEVDILTSDYYPISLLEAIFRLSQDKNGKLSLPKLVKALHSAAQFPAEILGLKGKGSIKQGSDADLILVRVKDTGQPEVKMTIVGGAVRYCKNPEILISTT